MFPLLGVFMQDRGTHSWGYTDWTNIEKHVGALTSSYGPRYKGAKQAALHTRYATHGAKTEANAHPWHFDKGLIGMHNGVVYNHKELNAAHDRKFEVDSMHIFQHIVEGRDLSEIEAYGAIVYWQDGKVWLGKFNGGDLCVARAPWGIVYASTSDAVADAFSMAGLPEPIYYHIDDGALYFIENGTLYLTDTKLNISEGLVTTTWDHYTESDKDWAAYRNGGSWPYEQGSLLGRGSNELTLQSDAPGDLSLGCELCNEPFEKGDNRNYNYTGKGWLCDECAEYMEDGELEEKDGTHTFTTTVCEWLGGADSHRPDELMLQCDGCQETLGGLDVLIVKSEDSTTAVELYCEECYHSRTEVLVN